MENNFHIGGKVVKPDWKLLNIQGVPGIDYIGDIRDLSQFASDSFDRVYTSHVLEHVSQPDMGPTLAGIVRDLKPGGLRAGGVFSDGKSVLRKWMNCSIVAAAMPIPRSSTHETLTQEPLREVQSPHRP